MARRITVKDVRASFNRTARDPASVKYFGRPLANVLTPFFFNRGWTANGMTYVCMGLSAIASGLLLHPSWAVHICAAALFYAVFVLDCVDGNLARLLDSASYYGKFIDGLSDGIFAFFAPLFAGIGLLAAGQDARWFAAGVLLTVTTLTAQMVRSRYSFFREWMVGKTGLITPEDSALLETPLRIERLAATAFVNSGFVAPLLLLLPTAEGYLLWLLIFQPAANIVWIVSLIWQASVSLRRSRRSIHAA